MKLKAQKSVLMSTAFSLFMLVVYNKQGVVVDYKRVVGKAACQKLATPSSNYFKNARRAGVKQASTKGGGEYWRKLHSMKCYPLNQWR